MPETERTYRNDTFSNDTVSKDTCRNAVAIITARGGSKRIPHKNIRDFCGRPILSYSIRAALESGAASDAPHGVREEVGDALFIAAKIAQMSGVDPEEALHCACDKFDRRFRAVEESADKPLAECTEEELADKPLSDYSEPELVALWKAAKAQDPS